MQKFRNIIDNFFCFFDTYATGIEIRFQHRSLYTSFYGTFISIVVAILLIVAFAFLFAMVNSKAEQTYTTFSARYDDPPEFNISSNYNDNIYAEDVANIGFFFVAIVMRDKTTQKFISKETYEQYFFVEITDVLKNSSGVQSTLGYLDLIQCSTIYPNITSILNNSIAGDAYCLNKTTIPMHFRIT